MKETKLVTEAAERREPSETVCPICRHRKSQTHCKHFVGIMPPKGDRISDGVCDVPAFHFMPDSERLLYTESPDENGITHFWMDYETGIDLVAVVTKQLRDAIDEDADLSGRVTVEDIPPAAGHTTVSETLGAGHNIEVRHDNDHSVTFIIQNTHPGQTFEFELTVGE